MTTGAATPCEVMKGMKIGVSGEFSVVALGQANGARRRRGLGGGQGRRWRELEDMKVLIVLRPELR
jgi:hypothetical protein